jgi:hypothetical protein
MPKRTLAAKSSALERRICERLRERAEELGISQAAIGRELTARIGGRWDQPRVWRILWQESAATVTILEVIANTLQTSLLDLVVECSSGAGPIVLMTGGPAAKDVHALSDDEVWILRHLRRGGATAKTREVLAGLADAHHRAQSGGSRRSDVA